MSGAPHRLDGHKIDDLADAIDSQQACNEDIGIRQVELFALYAGHVRRRDARVMPVLGGHQVFGTVKLHRGLPV